MNDEELRTLWNKHGQLHPSSSALSDLEAIRRKTSALHRVLKGRDVREILVSIVIILVFGYYLISIPHPLTRAGSTVVIAAALLICAKLLACRRLAAKADPTSPVVEWLRNEHGRMQQEAELMRTIGWWYLGPIWIGTNLFFWGFPNQTLPAKFCYSIVTFVLFAGIYWLNQYARRKQLLPVLGDLETFVEKQPEQDLELPDLKKKTATETIGWILFSAAMVFVFYQNSPPLAEPRAPQFSHIDGFTPTDTNKIDQWLQEQLARCKYPSLSVAVVQNGKVVYQKAFGDADLETKKSASPKTAYHVASVTKVFTATLAAVLDEEGVLNLDDPVAKYLPNNVVITSSPNGSAITLRQLATHTSGLPRGVNGPVQTVEGRYQLEPGLLYKELAQARLEFEPGRGELYSNLGFGLLGHVLERATRKSLDTLLNEIIFRPLEMEASAINPGENMNVATGYGSEVPRRPRTHSHRERMAASGGLVSSAENLAKFLLAQMHPGTFSTNVLSELQTTLTLTQGSKSRTALGWSARTNSILGRTFHKNGGRNNCSAWIGFAPEHQTGVVVLTNCGEPSVDPIGLWLLEHAVPVNHPSKIEPEN